MMPPYPKTPFLVRCVDVNNTPYLTIGKVYEVVTVYPRDCYEYFKIIDDRGKLGGWDITRFVELDIRDAIKEVLREHNAQANRTRDNDAGA